MLSGTTLPPPNFAPPNFARRGPAVPTTRRLHAEMRAALASRAFVLHYQPRLDLPTGAVLGCEALLRWPGRASGVLPPSTFIPVAERTGLINQLGAWALIEACAEASRWAGARVSVNVSRRQLQSGVLPAQLAEALDRSGLPPERLELELAEPALTGGGTDTLLALSAIRDLGVGLALDNFGAAGASLSMLKRLPLTTLKLDRSLVRELPGNREEAAIVHATIQAAHALGLTVVAEGIETEAQRATLSGLGCDQGQGYLFSHPLPAGQVRPIAAQHVTACGIPRSAPASAHERHHTSDPNAIRH